MIKTKDSGIAIIKRESGYSKQVYTVRLTNAWHKLSNQEMLEFCDAPFGAPFGGNVVKNNDDTYTVTVYTD